MKYFVIFVLFIQFSNALVWPIDSTGKPVSGSIRTFFMNPLNLWSNRELYRTGYHQLDPAVKRMARRCEGALLDNITYTVTSKPSYLIAPSGDPRDYYSLARYFWPNASLPGGLPYTRADGYINPEIYLLPDPAYVNVMFNDISDCSLAYFFTLNETYAEVAVKRMRDWFINNSTRMNPNLEYANWVKGTPMKINVDGSGISVSGNAGGLLDFIKLPWLVDSIGLLTNSKSFTSDDYNGMASWLQQFKTWLQTSSRGKTDGASMNNQGTWYDVMLLSLQLFLGLEEEAANHVGIATLNRIATQILPDGSQPLELSRAFSWLYSVYNLKALFFVGYLSQSTKVNLFQYQDDQGRSLVKALDFLIPYGISNGTNWPVPNLGDFNTKTLIQLCKNAYVIYRDVRYMETVNVLNNGIPSTSNPYKLWNPYKSFDNIRSPAIHPIALSTGFVLCILGWLLM